MMKSPGDSSETVVTGNEDTIKISTVVFFVLGLIVPFWIVTLPLCWFMAYRTFKSGGGTPIVKNTSIPSMKELVGHKEGSKLENIEKLKALLDSGALTEEEFKAEKAKILNQ